MCPFYTYNDHSFVFKYILHTSYVLQRVGHDWSSLAHTVKQCNQKYFIYENNEYMPVSLVYHCFMDNNISEVKKKFVKIWAYMLCQSLSKIKYLRKNNNSVHFPRLCPSLLGDLFLVYFFSVSPEDCRMLLSLHKYGLRNCDHHKNGWNSIFLSKI